MKEGFEMAYNTEKTINGTWGQVKINGELVAEAVGLEAKISVNKEEVKQTGTLSKGYKIVGIEGKGTIKLNKVYSRFINLMADNIKAGRSTVLTIESLLADPDSDGNEGVVLKSCIFDELQLINWESKKIGDESVSFTFEDFDITDTIDVPTAGE